MAETQDEQNLRCRGSNSTTHRSASLFWLCAVGAASGFVTHGAVLTRAATFANNSRTSQAVAQRSVPRVQVVGSDLDLMDTARADQVLGTTFRFEHRATRADTHLFGVCQPAAIRSDGVDGRYRPTAATGLAPVNGCSASDTNHSRSGVALSGQTTNCRSPWQRGIQHGLSSSLRRSSLREPFRWPRFTSSSVRAPGPVPHSRAWMPVDHRARLTPGSIGATVAL